MERLEGKTLGIVGFGDIGRAVAVRAHALGVRVLALRRSAALRPEDEGLVDAVYAAEQLKEMLPLCDFVVLATPLTPATLKLISKAELAAMKRTAFLINLGRGPVVDEAALIEALQEGVIRGAGLDVFEKEPLPAESPLYSMDNVLLSPHCADNTVGWKADSMRFFLEQLKRYQAGEPLKNIVDKKRGY